MQRNGRIKRLGSKHDNVTIYNLVTADGVDEKKFYKLMKQKEIIDKIVEKSEDEEAAVSRATRIMDQELIDELIGKK